MWQDAQKNVSATNVEGDIRFNQVSFAYPVRKNITVLQNLTFVARAGETTALVGSSGCGESLYALFTPL